MNASEIAGLLGRSYPLLLLDGVTSIEPDSGCQAFKNLTYNEWFFPSHFPKNPIMPGALQIEAFTQAVAVPLLVERVANANGDIPILLAGVEKARFFEPVIPGQKLEILVEIKRIAMGVASAVAVGTVAERRVSECQITYKLIGY